jgi:hypothetical protein
MNSLKWHAKESMKEKPSTRKEREQEMIQCAKQYARNHWPDGVEIQVLCNFNSSKAPYLNVHDPNHKLTEEHAIDFYNYMIKNFSDLMEDV